VPPSPAVLEAGRLRILQSLLERDTPIPPPPAGASSSAGDAADAGGDPASLPAKDPPPPPPIPGPFCTSHSRKGEWKQAFSQCWRCGFFLCARCNSGYHFLHNKWVPTEAKEWLKNVWMKNLSERLRLPGIQTVDGVGQCVGHGRGDEIQTLAHTRFFPEGQDPSIWDPPPPPPPAVLEATAAKEDAPPPPAVLEATAAQEDAPAPQEEATADKEEAPAPAPQEEATADKEEAPAPAPQEEATADKEEAPANEEEAAEAKEEAHVSLVRCLQKTVEASLSLQQPASVPEAPSDEVPPVPPWRQAARRPSRRELFPLTPEQDKSIRHIVPVF